MRNWLSWVVGFAISFSCVGGLLLAYSLSQASLWLPFLFGLAFYGLLALSPRIGVVVRIGIAVLFSSVSAGLWMISGADHFTTQHPQFQLAFEVLLGVLAVLGLATMLAGLFETKPKDRPALGSVLVLMALGWLVSYFSSTHGGSTPMIDWVMSYFGWERPRAETAVLIFRKSVHVTFYGIVALTAFDAARRNGTRVAGCLVTALLTTLVFASFDELRQSSQPDRTGSAWDVLLDMGGGTAVSVVVFALTLPKKSVRPIGARNSSTL